MVNSTRIDAVDGLLEGVEAVELALVGYVDAILDFIDRIEHFEAAFQAVGKEVGHGDELDRTGLGAKRLFAGARAASTATNQGDLDGLVAGRVGRSGNAEIRGQALRR